MTMRPALPLLVLVLVLVAVPATSLPGPASAASAAAAASAASAAAGVAEAASPAATPPRFAFTWPLDGDAARPRGGISRGAPVTLDTGPAPAWQALQAPGLAPAERDRRAIVAMAGTYRVTFDFLEVATFAAGERPAPYQSWGTEKVYVDRDEPGAVSLVHILEMRLVDADGKVGEPFVTKHWRQDWRYQPTEVVEYRGADRWQRRTVAPDERRGAWSQTVRQVDESPRYAALGRWQHTASFSTWISADTWRPLPRREWSVRSDYQVLLGTNRHTVVATGWLQEENNLKAVLASGGTIDARRPYVGREYGVARYERVRAGTDFAEADRYYAATRAFWDDVIAQWDADFRRDATITLRGPVDKLGLFQPLFERADRIADGDAEPQPDAVAIRAALDAMRAPR